MEYRRSRRRAVWGVFLIVMGVALLCARLGVIDYHEWRPWWPMTLIALGFAWIVAPGKPRHIASGINFVLIGLWFFACDQHWYGLTYRHAWPLLVVFAGVQMVLASVFERLAKANEEEHHA